jgi:hypothetical protein
MLVETLGQGGKEKYIVKSMDQKGGYIQMARVYRILTRSIWLLWTKEYMARGRRR